MNESGPVTVPVVGLSGAAYSYFGLPLHVWVSIATLTWVLVQIFCKVPDILETIKRLRARWRGDDQEGIDNSP